MKISKSTAVCFTGHRPEKLPDGGSRNSQKTRAIKSMLYHQISEALKDGYDTFITGMQRGIDLWAGEAVLDIMSTAKTPIKLIAVLPCKGFGSGFAGEEKFVFGRILEKAADIITVSGSYTRDCMLARNRFMVDNSSRLIAVMNSGCENTGTGYTLRYAGSCGLQIRLIDPAAMFASFAVKEEQPFLDITLYEPGEPAASEDKPSIHPHGWIECGDPILEKYVNDDTLELP